MAMLSIVLRNLITGPVTTRYPHGPADIPEGNRGRVDWDMGPCTLCGLCQKRCPTLAVKVDRKAGTIALEVFRCISCGVCIEACPQDAIAISTECSQPGYSKDVRTYKKEVTEERGDSRSPS
jgi:ech hydrogenase subunit F